MLSQRALGEPATRCPDRVCGSTRLLPLPSPKLSSRSVVSAPIKSPRLRPTSFRFDQGAEAQRAMRVQEDVGPVAPGLVEYTGESLFRDLWLRADLAPRDRSLVTVSALIAAGQVAQIPFHPNQCSG